MAHLLEHIIIAELKKYIIGGITTEDFIMLFCIDHPHDEVLNMMANLKIEKINIDKYRKSVKLEIIKSHTFQNEKFFKKVWHNTQYETSPVGIEIDLNKITNYDLTKIKNVILSEGFFTCQKDKIKVYNPHCKKENKQNNNKIKILKRSMFKHEGKYYRVIFFNGQFDVFYLISCMLRSYDIGEYVQAIQKKEFCTFILEYDYILPDYSNLFKLRRKCLTGINKTISKRRNSYLYRSMIELESMFYCNKTVDNRMKFLFSLDDREIAELYSLLKNVFECK